MEDQNGKNKKYQNITFHCPVELVARIDRLAEKGDVPRSKLMLNMVEMSLDFLESTQKVGIFQLSLLLRDAADSLKNVSKRWKEKK